MALAPDRPAYLQIYASRQKFSRLAALGPSGAPMSSDRTHYTGCVFMDDLADRMRHRVQLTTDGLKAYVEAVDYLFW